MEFNSNKRRVRIWFDKQTRLYSNGNSEVKCSTEDCSTPGSIPVHTKWLFSRIFCDYMVSYLIWYIRRNTYIKIWFNKVSKNIYRKYEREVWLG